MTLLTKIEGDAKTFAHDFEAAYVKLFQEEPKIEQDAAGTLSIVAPIVVAIVAATGNEAEAALTRRARVLRMLRQRACSKLYRRILRACSLPA
jgi:hypothetical protein